MSAINEVKNRINWIFGDKQCFYRINAKTFLKSFYKTE